MGCCNDKSAHRKGQKTTLEGKHSEQQISNEVYPPQTMNTFTKVNQNKNKNTEKAEKVNYKPIKTQKEGDKVEKNTYQTEQTEHSNINLTSSFFSSANDIDLSIQKLQPPVQYCSSNFRITYICTDVACKGRSAFFCAEPNCPTCEKQHFSHDRITLWDMTQLIERSTKELRNFTKQLLKIETNFIRQLRLFSQSLVQKYLWVRLGNENQNILEKVVQNEKFDLTSLEARSFRETLNDKVDRKEEERFLKQFEGELDIIKSDISNKKEHILHSISSREGFSKFNSKIADESTYNFIAKALTFEDQKRPKQVKLLYRASEHQFLASEFHKACDNITDTLTLLRTQFGSKVAGYTPLTWSSCEGQYITDSSGRSFLLSLDLLEKMQLTQKDYAIHRDKNWGPIFGAQDLAISDRCNINRNSSCSNFSHSYNFYQKYKKDQQAKKAFCGVSEGSNFEVSEYQVFSVSW